MLVDLRMSSLNQMKLMGLIDLTLILILASNSKGQSWHVNVSRRINATLGSNVTIPCTFTIPPEYNTQSVEVYWKKREGSDLDSSKNNRNAFVFHPNNTLVLEKYRGKTKLIGNESKGNCSLKIFDIMNNEQNIYVRVIAKGESYSFYTDSVSISVSGLGVLLVLEPDIKQPIPTFQTTTIFSTVGMTQEPPPQWHVVISVSVVAILIVIFVVGIVFGIKYKRSKSFTRKDSGYYANFSRANQLKSEAPCKKQEHNKPSELKDIDEPVYINIEAPPDQMDQSMDHTDNIYGNVDYSN
ncbi:sialic acid-binding Ig-like lectin 10 [Cebidichthys violaceus]|uniref:sialic acid-binding Ig-like lectin 10 n=1 Tax=Cebidichthys violaceus TaxID=271503 RepID=UPI0035CBCD11